jgi:hypothetical protein
VVSAVGLAGKPKLTSAVADALGDDTPVHVRSTTDSFDNDAIRAAVELTSVSTVLGELAVDLDDPRAQQAIGLLMQL